MVGAYMYNINMHRRSILLNYNSIVNNTKVTVVITVLECSQSSKQQEQNRSPSAVEKSNNYYLYEVTTLLYIII